MDRFIATVLLMLSLLQVEAMLMGVVDISMRTNWTRIGQYAVRQIQPSQDAGAAIQENHAADRGSKNQNRMIDLSTRGGGPRVY